MDMGPTDESPEAFHSRRRRGEVPNHYWLTRMRQERRRVYGGQRTHAPRAVLKDEQSLMSVFRTRPGPA